MPIPFKFNSCSKKCSEHFTPSAITVIRSTLDRLNVSWDTFKRAPKSNLPFKKE